jgi:hypothetical protein
MFSLSALLDHARRFMRHGLHLVSLLLDDFLNLGTESTQDDDVGYYSSSDPCQSGRRRPPGMFWSSPWMKAAGLATAGQFLVGLLTRLPVTGMMLLVSGIILGLVVVSLDADVLENLRQKLSS